MLEAFKYMFKSKNFLANYLICSFLSVFTLLYNSLSNGIATNRNEQISPFLIVLFLICALASIVISGYLASVVKYIMEYREDCEFKLPSFCPKNLIDGLKIFVSSLLLLVICVLVCIIPFLFSHYLQETFEFPDTVDLLAFIPIGVFLIYIILRSIALFVIFAKTSDIFSFVRFIKAEKIIKASGSSYIKGVFSVFGVNILYILVSLIITIMGLYITGLLTLANIHTKILIILSFILCAFIVAYVTFVNAYIFAKAVNNNAIEQEGIL